MIDLTQTFVITIKVLVLVLEALAVVFAFILNRQIKLMVTSFTTSAAGFFTRISVLIFFAAMGLLIVSFFVFSA